MEKKIKPVEKKNGTLKESVQDVGYLVPIKYIENSLCLHQKVASGSIDDNEYEIHLGYNGDFYIEFKNMKGSIPRLAIRASDLVQVAYNAVVKHDLLKKKS